MPYIKQSYLDGGSFILKYIMIIFMLVIMGIPRFAKYTTDEINITKPLTTMEALDKVKELYASNFTKISLDGNPEEYFYKLDIADYYLVYEDTDDNTGFFLFHLYEFILDDLESGIGHTVTYGWYWVNPYTGKMWEYDNASIVLSWSICRLRIA